MNDVHEQIWQLLGLLVRDGTVYAEDEQVERAADLMGPVVMGILLCLDENRAAIWLNHMRQAVIEGRSTNVVKEVEAGHA